MKMVSLIFRAIIHFLKTRFTVRRTKLLTHAMGIKTCHQYCKADLPIYVALFIKVLLSLSLTEVKSLEEMGGRQGTK